jgi:hypothetical protein
MANQDDDLLEAATQQFKVIEAARRRSEADLAEYRANGNTYGIAEELQTIANLDSSARNLSDLARRHAQASQPQAPVHQSDQEWFAKAPEKMDYNDVARIVSKSKYGFDDARFRAGIQEVARRRARGE